MSRVYLSLGSNLEPEKHLRAAINELRMRFGELLVSPTYRTEAVGFEGPAFLNLAIGMDADLSPDALNQWLHALEERHGRRRDAPRWSSRTLDVDIVLYDDLVMQGEGNLDIPRNELKHVFVLKPLADIAPQTKHPVSGISMAALWRAHAQHDAPPEVVALE